MFTRNRRMGWVLGAAWLAAVAAPGQVNLGVRLPNAVTLAMESVPVQVTVANNLATPLKLGGKDANADLMFDVLSGSDLVARTSAPILDEPVEIPPRRTTTLTLDLARLYAVGRTGPYKVAARLAIPGNQDFTSSYSYLDVVPGLEIARLVCEPPGKSGARLLCTLRTLSRQREEHVFVRVEDDTRGVGLGAFDLGSIVRVFQPQMILDDLGCVHVLHQSAPGRFTHTVVDPGSLTVTTEFLSPRGPEIRIYVDDEGDIQIPGTGPYQGDPYVAPRLIDEPRAPGVPRPSP